MKHNKTGLIVFVENLEDYVSVNKENK